MAASNHIGTTSKMRVISESDNVQPDDAAAPDVPLALPRLGQGGVPRVEHLAVVRHVHAERHELLHRRAQLPEELRGALLPAEHGRPGVRAKLTRRSAREKRALVHTGGRREQARAFHSHFHTTMFICFLSGI